MLQCHEVAEFTVSYAQRETHLPWSIQAWQAAGRKRSSRGLPKPERDHQLPPNRFQDSEFSFGWWHAQPSQPRRCMNAPGWLAGCTVRPSFVSIVNDPSCCLSRPGPKKKKKHGVCLVPTKFPNFPSHPSHLLSHQNIKYSR